MHRIGVLFAVWASIGWTWVASAIEVQFQHGVATFGALKYDSDFKAFDYTNPDAPIRGTFRLGVLGRFDSLNPYVLKGDAAAGLSYLEDNLLHASLLKKSGDEPFSSYGYVAEGVAVSKDGRQVTFRLRPQARFHDGSKILPEDVMFTFAYLHDEGLPFFKTYYKGVERVEKTGPLEVTFVLKENPSVEMPSILGQLPVLPRSFYGKKKDKPDHLTPPLGSGPYRVVQVDPGKRIVYERVKNWWADGVVPAVSGFFRFEKIQQDYFRELTVLFEALKKGQIDFEMLSSKQAVALESFEAVQKGDLILRDILHQIPYGHIGFIFNLRSPLFQDIRVRQALGLVFDFDWINRNLLEGKRKRVTSFFTHSDFEAHGALEGRELEILKPFQDQLPKAIFEKAPAYFMDEGLKDLRQRRRRALDLFKEAGWVLKDGKMVNAVTGKPFAITFLLAAGSPFAKVVSHYQESLRRQLGISLQVRSLDPATLEAASQRFDFEMMLALIPGSYNLGNELWNHFGSAQAKVEGSRNLAGIQSPVVDHLIRQIIDAPSYDQLRHVAKALDRVLMSGFYSVPAFYPPTFQVAHWSHVKLPKILPTLTGLDPMTFWIEP